MLTSTWNGLGFILKTTRFNNSESTLSFERRLYTRCTFRFQTLQHVFLHLELCYTLHERSFSKIHNRGTLRFFINLYFCIYLVYFSSALFQLMKTILLITMGFFSVWRLLWTSEQHFCVIFLYMVKTITGYFVSPVVGDNRLSLWVSNWFIYSTDSLNTTDSSGNTTAPLQLCLCWDVFFVDGATTLAMLCLKCKLLTELLLKSHITFAVVLLVW